MDFSKSYEWKWEMNKPKLLFYDIETSPNIGYTWEKYEQNVLSFIKEREILSCAYKWQGESNIHCITKQGQKTDHRIVQQLHSLFAKADILIAHNNDKFDQGIVKARMIYYNMLPPRILQSVDTRKVAKHYFKFNGNGLNDLGEFLKLGKKRVHTGFDMWLGCMSDKASSWKQMVKYNKQDVALLQKVYNRLRPWIHNHPRLSSISTMCPNGPSHHIQARGYRATQVTVKRQMFCKDCNIWFLISIRKVPK
jgi:uncharacterized protein YprB with RNaseH-like and TPR domain